MHVCNSHHLFVPSFHLPLPPPTSPHTFKTSQSSCINRHVKPMSGSSLSLPLSLFLSHSLPALFSSVCFHSPSFRVITWHLHCKVPCAALSSSAGDWASFPQQIRERERKRKRGRKGELQHGVMLFWLAEYRNNALNALFGRLLSLKHAHEVLVPTCK